jgi:hypothetical protein
MLTCMYEFMYVSTHTCMYACMWVSPLKLPLLSTCTPMDMHTHRHKHLCLYVCMHACPTITSADEMYADYLTLYVMYFEPPRRVRLFGENVCFLHKVYVCMYVCTSCTSSLLDVSACSEKMFAFCKICMYACMYECEVMTSILQQVRCFMLLKPYICTHE